MIYYPDLFDDIQQMKKFLNDIYTQLEELEKSNLMVTKFNPEKVVYLKDKYQIVDSFSNQCYISDSYQPLVFDEVWLDTIDIKKNVFYPSA